MTEKREIKGFWWTPDKPEYRVFGILTLELGEGAQLVTFAEGGFTAEAFDPNNQVIHGQDEHAKPVTLLFVMPPRPTISGGLMQRSFHVGYVVFGIALPDSSSFIAHELQLWIQHFHGWAGTTGFVDDSELKEETTIRYRHPDEVYYRISDDLEVGIGVSMHAQHGLWDRGIKENAWISFRSKAGFSFHRSFKLLDAVRLLLHFAILKPVYPVEISVEKEGHGYSLGDRWIKQTISLWGSILREPKSEYPFDAARWVFQLKDFGNAFSTRFTDWLDYVERYHEALGCYSSTIYHSLTHELTHLSLTQALDAYHGQKHQSHKNQDFKAKIQELATPHTTSLAGLVDDVPAFVEQVQATRNFYTHHNPKWKATGKVAEKADLYRLNEKLRLLFQMCVLTDIKIPADRFSRLRHQLATHIIDFQ